MILVICLTETIGRMLLHCLVRISVGDIFGPWVLVGIFITRVLCRISGGCSD